MTHLKKLENFLSLRQHNCLLHPHASNARHVNEPFTQAAGQDITYLTSAEL